MKCLAMKFLAFTALFTCSLGLEIVEYPELVLAGQSYNLTYVPYDEKMVRIHTSSPRKFF
jgi:hypothetical protein